MSEPTKCRLLLDPPASGAWNMAVDEVLLERAAEESQAYLRFYAWEEPTLSLGYFQDDADRRLHPSSRDCPAVRRLTGGGAIVHDAEVTYSLILPGRHCLAACRDRLYEVVHGSLIQALGDLGIRATLCGTVTGEGRAEEPFLCFQRRSPGDVLVGDHKIAGSAQRRRRGAVLQHGSVLLRRSPAAPELAGLLECCGKDVPAQELVRRWTSVLAGNTSFRWISYAMSEGERQRATLLAKTRYASPDWARPGSAIAGRPLTVASTPATVNRSGARSG